MNFKSIQKAKFLKLLHDALDYCGFSFFQDFFDATTMYEPIK